MGDNLATRNTKTTKPHPRSPSREDEIIPYPFILEATASVETRLYVWADDYEQAQELLQERAEELVASITDHFPGLKDADGVGYTLSARGAHGYEVVGPDALTPGIPTVSTDEDICDDPDHEHA